MNVPVQLALTDDEANALIWTLRHAKGWPEAPHDGVTAFFNAQAAVADRLEEALRARA